MRSQEKMFTVTITETLSRTVEVETKDQQEAIQLVSAGWRDSDYILGAEDFIGVDFAITEDCSD